MRNVKNLGKINNKFNLEGIYIYSDIFESILIYY